MGLYRRKRFLKYQVYFNIQHYSYLVQNYLHFCAKIYKNKKQLSVFCLNIKLKLCIEVQSSKYCKISNTILCSKQLCITRESTILLFNGSSILLHYLNTTSRRLQILSKLKWVVGHSNYIYYHFPWPAIY